jgi:hypothetical protein
MQTTTTTTTPRTIHTAAAELTAAGYDAQISRDGWIVVLGDNWEASFSANDGNDITWGDVPQQVFDLAYFESKTALDALLEDGSWTRDGAIALTDYLGIQDVPAQAVNVSLLADNWVEYSSALEASAEHGHTASDEDEALAWLRARTIAIPFDSGVIVVNF